MKHIPVDLIIHSLIDLLATCKRHQGLVKPLTFCLDVRQFALESRETGVDQVDLWLLKRLDNETELDFASPTEVAVANRIAATAFALMSNSGAEEPAHILLDAAQRIVGLPVTVPAGGLGKSTVDSIRSMLGISGKPETSVHEAVAAMVIEQNALLAKVNAATHEAKPFKFKIGDKVRFNQPSKPTEHPSYGEKGHIDRMDDSDHRLPVRVKWEGCGDLTTWHHPEHLMVLSRGD